MPAKRVGRAKADVVKVPKRKLKLEYVAIDKLKKWKKNPRRNDQAAEKLLGLLSVHGFIDPIIATPDRVIRAGHTRLKAAQKTDLTELPVIFVDFGSEESAEMYAVSDNRAGEWAEWDEDVLANVLAERRKLPDEKMAEMSGFEQTEITGLRSGENLDGINVNDPNAEWEGMPEFEHEDQTSFQRVVVHFKNQKDRDYFAKLVKQTITDHTKSLWFPETELGTYADKRYAK